MKNPIFFTELKKLETHSNDALEGLRLLKAFIKLRPEKRLEMIELLESLAFQQEAHSGSPDCLLS